MALRGAFAALLAALALPAAAQVARPSQPEPPSGWTARAPSHAARYMVAAANPLAVDAGLRMLAAGGTAADAAIAVQLVLTLVEPHASGLGGGAFLSSAKIRVQVFADINGNGLPEPPEMANDVEVLMQFADGNELSGRTVNGEVVFDLTGYPIGMGMTVSLPSFYRTEQLTVPPDGETLVTFKFTGPPFPTALP